MQVAAYVVEAAQDMVSLAILRSFENGVFHKMGKSVLVGLLVAGASFHHQHQMGYFARFCPVYQFDSVG